MVLTIYHINGDTQKKGLQRIINEEQTEVVRKIFDLYLSGYSAYMIMKELASSSIKPPTGKDTWPKHSMC